MRVERERLADLVRQPAAASSAAAGFLAALERDERRELESGTTSADGLLRHLAAAKGARIRIFATEDGEYAYVLFTDEGATEAVACFAVRKRP